MGRKHGHDRQGMVCALKPSPKDDTAPKGVQGAIFVL